MEFIIESAKPILLGLGLLLAGNFLLVWPCLAMSKRCEEGEDA